MPKEVRYQELQARRDSRLCKIYNEYEICKMQYVKGGSCRTGWVWINVLLIGKPATPIPDRLSDVLPGWVWGFFTFCELELSLRRSIWSGMWEAQKEIVRTSNAAAVLSFRDRHLGEGNPPYEEAECFLWLLSFSEKGERDQYEKFTPPCPLTISPVHSSPHLPNKSDDDRCGGCHLLGMHKCVSPF